VAKGKLQVSAQVNEMQRTLTDAKIPAEQIPGLIRIHKSAVANSVAHLDLVVVSFMIFVGLLTTSFGLIITLWARLRLLTKAEPTNQASPA
jgi:protein-S-isoprenylcysteine O-methyltransferase Ste14